MTDLRTRTLERRVAHGDESALTDLLREKLRSQDNPCPAGCASGYEIGTTYNDPCRPCAETGLALRPHVELAAYCNFEPAVAVIGSSLQHYACACHGRDASHGHGPIRNAPFSDWVNGLNRWLSEPFFAPIRAAVAVAQAYLPESEESEQLCCCGSIMRHHSMGSGHGFLHACDYYSHECDCAAGLSTVRAMIKFAQEFLGCPCERHSRAWWEASLAAVDPHRNNDPWRTFAFIRLTRTPLGASQDPDTTSQSRPLTFIARITGTEHRSEEKVRRIISEALAAQAMKALGIKCSA